MHEQIKYTLALGVPIVLIVCVLVLLKLPIFADIENKIPRNAIIIDKTEFTLSKELVPGWNLLWPSSDVSFTQISEKITQDGCSKIVPLNSLVDDDDPYLRNQIFIGKTKLESTIDHGSHFVSNQPVWVYLVKQPQALDSAFTSLNCLN